MIRPCIRHPLRVMAAAAAVMLGSVVVLARPAASGSRPGAPELEIRSGWPAVSAEQAEEHLTSVLEGEAELLRGVRRVLSLTEVRQGRPEAVVRITFARGTDLGYARLELSQRLAALRGTLPANAMVPVVSPVEPEGAGQAAPGLRYLVTSAEDGYPAAAQAGATLVAALRGVPGIVPRQEPVPTDALLVEIDAARTLGPVAPDELAARMESAARARPVSRDGAAAGVLPVVIDPIWREPASLGGLPVVPGAMRPELSAFTRIRVGGAEPSQRVRMDGSEAVELIVEPGPGSRSLLNAPRVRTAVEQAVARLPVGTRVMLVEDGDAAASARASQLRARLILGVTLAALLLVAWLGELRWAGIPLLCAAMAAVAGSAGFRLLTGPGGPGQLTGVWVGTLLALGKAARVLDGAADSPGPSFSATRSRRTYLSSARLVLPMAATTAMLAAAIVPLLALAEEARQRYLPLFSAALAVDVAGLLVALTLAPALAVHTWPGAPWDAGRGGGSRAVRAAVRGTHPLIVLVVLGTVCLWAARRFERYVPRGEPVSHRPEEGVLLAALEMPRGATLPAAEEAARRLEAVVIGLPGVAHVITRIWTQSAQVRVELRERANRQQALVVQARLEAAARQMGGAEVQVEGVGGSQHPSAVPPPRYLVRVSGYSQRGVAAAADEVARRVAGYPRVQAVDSHASARWDPRGGDRELVVELDPVRLGRNGADASVVSAALGASLEGQSPRAMLEMAGRELPLYLSAPRTPALDVAGLERFELPLESGGIIRLGSVGAVRSGPAISRIERVNQEYRRLVAWEFMGPAKLGERVRAEVMGATALPAGYRLSLPEAARPEGESRSYPLYRALAAGVGLALLVSAAVLESATAPLRLLLALMAAATGVMAAFDLCGAVFSRDAVAGCLLAATTVPGVALGVAMRGAAKPRRARMEHPPRPLMRPIALPALLVVAGIVPFATGGVPLQPEPSRAFLLSLIGGAAGVMSMAPPGLWAIRRLGERRTGPAVPDPDTARALRQTAQNALQCPSRGG